MALQPYVSGPVQIFIGLGAGGALLPLGLNESPPRYSGIANHDDLFSDVGGQTPVDSAFHGELAMISGDLTIYNEPLWQSMESRLVGGTAGSGAANSIGTLMQLEGHSYRLLLNFPYAAKSSYAGMQACRNYLSAYLYGAYDIEAGTKRKVIHYTFRAQPVVNYSTGAWVLWNSSNAGMPAFA